MSSSSSDENDTQNFDQEPAIEEDDENDRSEIRNELSTMSFEDLMKLKEELGSKVYNEAIFGNQPKNIKRKTKTEFKRANKNRPREETAKRQVPFLGAELRKQTNSTVVRDPRFDEKCGEYNIKAFKYNYAFVNDIREKEVKKLKTNIKKAPKEEKPKIKFAIEKLENQLREDKTWKTIESIKKEAVEDIKKAKEEGKQPHYATKRELQTKMLVKQFEDLKNSGKLAKHLEKKRKKNISKDRKKVLLY